MKTLVCLLAILCWLNLAWPCANFRSSATKLSGESTRATITADRELRNAIQRNPQDEGRTIEAKLRGSTKFEDRSDYAVALMYLGRSSEAVELLRSLEREQPGDYSVAANLGTALELSGDNAGALKWIREGNRAEGVEISTAQERAFCHLIDFGKGPLITRIDTNGGDWVANSSVGCSADDLP